MALKIKTAVAIALSICHDDKVAYRPFIVRCSFIVNIRYIDNNGSYCFKIS